MIATIYCRKSDDDGRAVEDKSVARQEQQAREFCAVQGWSVGDVFTDDGISGTIFDLSRRRGLGQLLAALQAKPRFDVVVTMEQSRLGRDIAKTLDLIATIEAAGVEVWSYSERRRISVEEELDEMNASMKAIIDKAESRRASTRTSASLARLAQRGCVTGQAAFGYSIERVGDHSEYGINEDQAAIVRRIFSLAAEGYGARRICDVLNNEKIKAPGTLRRKNKNEMTRSELWSKHTVKPILERRLYIGELVFGVTRSKGKRDGVKKGAKPSVTAVPHLRLIEQAVWDKVEAQRTKHRAEYLRQANGRLLGKPEVSVVARRLMNSIGRCHLCQGPLVYVSKSEKHKARYYCSNRTHRGRVACENKFGVLADSLDRAVLSRLNEVLTDPKAEDLVWTLVTERAARVKVEQAGRRDVQADMEAEVAKLEAAISRLEDAIEQGQPVGDRLKKRKVELDELRWKMEADEPEITREFVTNAMRGVGPLVPCTWPLTPEDTARARSMLRLVGVDRLTVAPDGQGSWTFKGDGDFSGLVLGHKRVKAGPVEAPHVSQSASGAAAIRSSSARL